MSEKRKTLEQVEQALSESILHNTIDIDTVSQTGDRIKEALGKQTAETAKIRLSLDNGMVAMNSHTDRIDKIEELQEKERVQMDDTVGCLTDHAKRVDGILKGMKKQEEETSGLSRRCSVLEDHYVKLSDGIANLVSSLAWSNRQTDDLANIISDLTSKKTTLFKRIGAAWRAFKDPDAGN